MARNPTTTGTATNARKRKSTGNIEDSKTKPAKQPRKTLDAFFSPQATTSCLQPDGTIVHEHVTLNEEQIGVLRMVVNDGKSVFFTGAAGTGKSLLLRAIIAALRKKHSGKKLDEVSVTASTGMAAMNIGGTTIHAWGAITPGMHNVDKLISYIKTCRPAHQRWKKTQVLIIDEVSMVDGHLFDTMAKLAVQLRKKPDLPFGGIQLVVTGDFFQLPPVAKGTGPFFAFESEAWKKCIQNTITLKQVFRQKDSHFADLLNQMRQGEITPEAKKVFIGLSRPLTFTDGILPTELFSLRIEVERANASRLTALPGPAVTYEARDSGAAPKEKRAKLLENMVAAERLELKADAQVMLVKNVDETLVNGSVGKVLGFFGLATCSASVAPEPAPAEGKKEGVPSAKPASSVKPKSSSQESGGKHNATVRRVQVGPDGRTPIAYRPPTPEEKENTLGAATSASAKSKDKGKAPAKSKAKDDELYPLVEFFTPQGKEIVLVVRDEFRAEDNEGKLLARRVQIPLVLAWAMSIHKSQGQTIERVKIDLRRVFERGQSYVALSRAASMDGLQVIGFDATKVKAHDKVIKWSKNMEQPASEPSKAESS